MVPSMPKNMKSSMSAGFQVEPGFLARRRPSHQAAAKATRYMIPYQWTFSETTPKYQTSNGPNSKAIFSKRGYGIIGRKFYFLFARDAAEKCFQVLRFRDRGMHGMVGRLTTLLQHLHEPAGVPRRGLDRVDELIRSHVIGA